MWHPVVAVLVRVAAQRGKYKISGHGNGLVNRFFQRIPERMKVLTPQQAKGKIERYCAYQERSHKEVKNKLYGYGLYRDDVDQIISNLITEGFLNEERFARAYAGGKFRMKKWGKIRIIQALEEKGVSPNCIRISLTEIDDTAYADTLRIVLTGKFDLLQAEADNEYVLRDKLSRYAIQKGFEPELVWKTIYSIFPKRP